MYDILDIITIEESDLLLLAGGGGILKATVDQAIIHYFKGMHAKSICHIAESFFLVGFFHDGLIVWNEQIDQQLFQIC